ncbi:hypothetical protein ACFVV7_35955 [Streptomyces globisporus]|uniref:hypothetical protein n=1 Tax=Streptomyces globisporus TaxID=1908 RepID=UPI0036DAA706
MSRLPHPSLLPTLPTPTSRSAVGRPLDLRVHVQRIQIDDLVVADPRSVLAHARAAAHADPETAALVGYSPSAPLTLPAAATLLCALHSPDELMDMGLRIARHTTRVTGAAQRRSPVSLELSDAPE